jgi:hypothetical protein
VGEPDAVNRNLRDSTESRPTTRAASQAELDRVETLTLEDCAVDFSKVEIPETQPGERLSDLEMETLVGSFLTSLKGEERSR